jgi:hypothetical protein
MTEDWRHSPKEDLPSEQWRRDVIAGRNGVSEIRAIYPPIGLKDWGEAIARGVHAP